PLGGHQGGDGNSEDGDICSKRRSHFVQDTPQRGLCEAPRDEQNALRERGALRALCRRRRRAGGRLGHQRGSPLLTNLFGVPSRAAPLAGRQSTASSMRRASSKSLSVIPPALCVISFTVRRAYVTDKSGW